MNKKLLAALCAVENIGFITKIIPAAEIKFASKLQNEREMAVNLLQGTIETDEMQYLIEEEATYWFNKFESSKESDIVKWFPDLVFMVEGL